MLRRISFSQMLCPISSSRMLCPISSRLSLLPSIHLLNKLNLLCLVRQASTYNTSLTKLRHAALTILSCHDSSAF